MRSRVEAGSLAPFVLATSPLGSVTVPKKDRVLGIRGLFGFSNGLVGHGFPILFGLSSFLGQDETGFTAKEQWHSNGAGKDSSPEN